MARVQAGYYLKRLWASLLAAMTMCFAQPAIAQSCTATDSDRSSHASYSVRLDNDVLGGRRQDQNYTGGTIVTVVSPNLSSFTDDPCLSSAARWLNRKLTWLQPADAQLRNMVFGLSHLAFTPGDRLRTDVIADDRPYAAALLFNIAYNGRNDATMHTTQLRFGLVGPGAQGERVQNVYHDSLGLKRFAGWNNQLRNEWVAQLLYERLYRWSTVEPSRGWGSDVISHWGASLGNFATHANAGAEWRFGWRVPDDFGSAPLRPAGESVAPSNAANPNSGWTAHLFVSLDARAVLRDMTLDGNTFTDSHHVDKRHWVADFGFGWVLRVGEWKLAMTRYYRTREFNEQRELPAFGSISISRRI
jgi:lipid A 3-O-deacylase